LNSSGKGNKTGVEGERSQTGGVIAVSWRLRSKFDFFSIHFTSEAFEIGRKMSVIEIFRQ
jgi:hypothetical protein